MIEVDSRNEDIIEEMCRAVILSNVGKEECVYCFSAGGAHRINCLVHKSVHILRELKWSEVELKRFLRQNGLKF